MEMRPRRLLRSRLSSPALQLSHASYIVLRHETISPILSFRWKLKAMSAVARALLTGSQWSSTRPQS
jgi:hypothetical protein